MIGSSCWHNPFASTPGSLVSRSNFHRLEIVITYESKDQRDYVGGASWRDCCRPHEYRFRMNCLSSFLIGARLIRVFVVEALVMLYSSTSVRVHMPAEIFVDEAFCSVVRVPSRCGSRAMMLMFEVHNQGARKAFSEDAPSLLVTFSFHLLMTELCVPHELLYSIGRFVDHVYRWQENGPKMSCPVDAIES